MKWRLTATAVTMLAVVPPIRAQDDVTAYPNRQITLITLTAAGAALDVVARIIGNGLQEQMGQPVVVVNRTGAGGNIGAGEIARAKPDGSVFGMITGGTHGVNPTFVPNPPFDAIKDFAPITMAADLNIMLVVQQSFPAKSLADLIAYSKANPGKLSFGSAGVGTGLHMTGELLKLETGLDMTHVPYQGVAKSLPDLLGGQLQVLMANPADIGNLVREGQLRALGVAARQREATLADVPTFGEQGYAKVVGSTWFGIAGPAGLSRPIVERLNKEVHAALRKPQAAQRLGQLGMNVILNSPEEFAAYIKSEIERWAPIVKAAKATMK